jgi:hypothetical protein
MESYLKNRHIEKTGRRGSFSQSLPKRSAVENLGRRLRAGDRCNRVAEKEG